MLIISQESLPPTTLPVALSRAICEWKLKVLDFTGETQQHKESNICTIIDMLLGTNDPNILTKHMAWSSTFQHGSLSVAVQWGLWLLSLALPNLGSIVLSQKGGQLSFHFQGWLPCHQHAHRELREHVTGALVAGQAILSDLTLDPRRGTRPTHFLRSSTQYGTSMTQKESAIDCYS